MAVRQIGLSQQQQYEKKIQCWGMCHAILAAVVGTLPFPGSRACPLPGASMNDHISIMHFCPSSVQGGPVSIRGQVSVVTTETRRDKKPTLSARSNPCEHYIGLNFSTSPGPSNYTCTATETFLLNSALIRVIFSDFSSNSETGLRIFVVNW